MAQDTIGEIDAASTPLTGAEKVEIEQSAVSKRTTVADLRGQGISVKTASYTILDVDADVFEFDGASTDSTFTLPTLADNKERIIALHNADDTYKATLDGEGAEEIDGRTSLALYTKGGVIIVRGGTNEWEILAYTGGEPITNAVRIIGEYQLTEDNELDYSASFTNGMADATITFTELPTSTRSIHVKIKLIDSGAVDQRCRMSFKRSSGGTEGLEISAQFADAGATNELAVPVWLPTDNNTIRVTQVDADGSIQFKIVGYKVGE